MRTYEPWMSTVLFQCEPLNIDTRKDLWSSKCGVGCGQGRDFSCTFNYLLNSFTRLFLNPKKGQSDDIYNDCWASNGDTDYYL